MARPDGPRFGALSGSRSPEGRRKGAIHSFIAPAAHARPLRTPGVGRHPIDRATNVGPRATWIKRAKPNLERLRLALHAGNGLSVRDAAGQPGNPHAHAALANASIDVGGARFIGRKQPFELRVNPWLSARIGGRGTGRSILVKLPVGEAGGGSGRSYFMEAQGDGVPVILRETRSLSGQDPVWRVIDDSEVLLTLPAATP